MSLFPRSLASTDPATSFGPLFRLLDDFDDYSRSNNNSRHHHRGGNLRTFTPKFDVKELPESYELHGELPGIEQKDVEIEFTDQHTLTVRGRTEHSYTSGTPPTGAIESSKPTGTITDGKETKKHEAHQATVEDADTPEDTSGSNVVAKTANKPEEPQPKYWVSERSVGEFARSFNFPANVDQESVKASMKNGILSIVVPKAKKVQSRKITIS